VWFIVAGFVHSNLSSLFLWMWLMTILCVWHRNSLLNENITYRVHGTIKNGTNIFHLLIPSRPTIHQIPTFPNFWFWLVHFLFNLKSGFNTLYRLIKFPNLHPLLYCLKFRKWKYKYMRSEMRQFKNTNSNADVRVCLY
jgi:hypothetical protein